MANPGNDPKETMSLTYPPTTKGPMSPWCKSSLPWCDRACTLGFSFRFRHKLLRNGHRTVDGCRNCCWNLPIRWPVQYIPWKYHEWGSIPHTSIYTWRYYQPIFHFLQLLKRMNGVKCSDLEASMRFHTFPYMGELIRKLDRWDTMGTPIPHKQHKSTRDSNWLVQHLWCTLLRLTIKSEIQ